MWENMVVVARRLPNAAMFVIAAAVAGMLSFTDMSISSALFGFVRFDWTVVSLFLVAFIAIPLVVMFVGWLLTRDLERVNIWLQSLWISIAIGTLCLAANQFVVKNTFLYPSDIAWFQSGAKEIYGLVTTLYAFVAGFLLLFMLQEFSSVKTEFNEELNTWFVLRDLLGFFLVPPGRTRDDDQVSPSSRENDRLARACIAEITSLTSGTLDPERGGGVEGKLRKIYKNILLLKVEDDNDGDALQEIVRNYCKLRVLLRRRKTREIRSPRMLMLHLWIVAAIVIVLSALAVSSLFSPNELAVASGRIEFLIFITVIVLPITLINMTINDLRNPFSGEWAIDVDKEYRELGKLS